MRRALCRPLVLVAAGGSALSLAGLAWAGSPVITIGALSQQVSASTAKATATITAKSTTSPTASTKTTTSTKAKTGAASVVPDYPTLAANSPLLAEAHPFGPASFWYHSGAYSCIYLPDASPDCYTIVAAPKPTPPVNPAALAAQAATTLDLTAGTLEASPTATAGGLTGAASWFWLSPAPAEHSATASLDGEHVTVRADPGSVSWSFGDGASVQAGAGVAYRTGPTPTGALLHTYGTRCLPGDKGRNPNVLASCGDNGYTVAATVSWQLSYQATGPVTASAGLSARTTSVSISYPVSEARAFLGGGG
jgi:hypothetical protein